MQHPFYLVRNFYREGRAQVFGWIELLHVSSKMSVGFSPIRPTRFLVPQFLRLAILQSSWYRQLAYMHPETVERAIDSRACRGIYCLLCSGVHVVATFRVCLNFEKQRCWKSESN